MSFLPIVERELRAASRQRATHWMRLIAAGLALTIWFGLAVFGNNLTPAQRATTIFGTINILSLGFAMLAGVFLTADCLSEERREGTLGLLFLTDLKGHDVVLGKLASTSLHSIYGLLAVVPMLAIPLLMGGVTPGEFVRSALVLLVTLFLSLSAGMLVSAVNHDSRAVVVKTLVLIVTLAGVLPLLWWMLRTVFRVSRFDFLLWPSPGYALRYAGDAFYSSRVGAGQLWLSVGMISALALLFLATASVRLPRVWQQVGEVDTARPRPARAGVQHLNSRQRPLLGARPYHWLTLRDDRVGRWTAWIVGSVLLVWLAFFLHAGVPRPGRAAFMIILLMAFALHVFCKCMVAVEATRRLSEDRHSGALELLLVTPLSPPEIMAAQKAALAHLFRWPKLMLTAMNSLLIGMILWPGWSARLGPDEGIFVTMFLGGMVLLYTDCFVMGPAGVWSALTTKRHTRAILKTIRTVLLPSWLGILLFWFIGVTGGGMSVGTVHGMVVAWVLLGLGINIGVQAFTTRQLNFDFRELAATGQARPVELNAGTAV